MADEVLATLLSLANVKTYVMAGETSAPTDWDIPLQVIIDAVIEAVQKEVGCNIAKATYTSEKASGNGTSMLYLKHWPIASVTTLADVYGTTYAEGIYLDYTVEDYGVRAASTWEKGHNNFTVTYVAGWSTIPRGIVLTCYELIAAAYKAMKMSLQGETSRNFPDGSVAFGAVSAKFTPEQLARLVPFKRPVL